VFTVLYLCTVYTYCVYSVVPIYCVYVLCLLCCTYALCIRTVLYLCTVYMYCVYCVVSMYCVYVLCILCCTYVLCVRTVFTVLYLCTVYTYSLRMYTHVYIFCFTTPNDSVLTRVIQIFILKLTLNLFCSLHYAFSLILLSILYLDIWAFSSGLKDNRLPNATSEVLQLCVERRVFGMFNSRCIIKQGGLSTVLRTAAVMHLQAFC